MPYSRFEHGHKTSRPDTTYFYGRCDINKIISLVVIVSLSLSGCGLAQIKEQRAKFVAKNKQLVGNTYDDLIKEYGVPTGEVKLSDGGMVVEYLKSSTAIWGGGSYFVSTPIYVPNPNGGAGTWIYSQQQQYIPVNSVTESCKLDFVISPKKIIENWKARGNACY